VFSNCFYTITAVIHPFIQSNYSSMGAVVHSYHTNIQNHLLCIIRFTIGLALVFFASHESVSLPWARQYSLSILQLWYMFSTNRQRMIHISRYMFGTINVQSPIHSSARKASTIQPFCSFAGWTHMLSFDYAIILERTPFCCLAITTFSYSPFHS
jgi:hypothetical protein